VLGTNGIFYGTTVGSGVGQTVSDGTVFCVTTNGLLTTLFAFDGTNGAAPSAPLLIGSDGALYGTTANGSGASGGGTVFRLALEPILPVPLNIQSTAGGPLLTWTNPIFSLQASPSLTGPFTNVPNAYSPYINTFTNQMMFFRLRADIN